MGQTPFMSALLADEVGTASPTGWFDRLRSTALEHANAASVPSTREEDWRFTDLSSLSKLTFQPATQPVRVADDSISGCVVPEASARIVFVDGIYVPEFSIAAAGAGLRVLDLQAALARHSALMEASLATIVPARESVFAALNLAFLREAAIVLIDADAVVQAPLHVLHLATKREQPQAIYPRMLVVAGRHSRCTVIEDFLALDAGAYFSAPVTEIIASAGSCVSHVRLQRDSATAYQLGHCGVAQAGTSRYELVNVALGARLSRLDLAVRHEGPGCETQIDGLALVGGRQLADTHSSVDHAHAQGRLRQVYKCVVGGGAHAVFNGKILVREGAQQTDAGQSCRGLLLSDRAHIDAKPQLEIFADDVKCAHGAAIGQLDPEEMFYLRSRGLSEERARNLLTYAFAAEVIERIPVPSLRKRLAQTVLERTQEAA